MSRVETSSLLGERIENKSAKIGVIGLGYVGLPLAVEFAKKGFSVTGIDVDEEKVKKINAGENYIRDVNDDDLKAVVFPADRDRPGGTLVAATDYAVVKDLDTVSICVPTPLNKLKDPDISFINAVLAGLIPNMHGDFLVVLESTTYPGTTRDLLLPELEKSGLTVGEDFFLCFSPERIDPGNTEYGIRNTPRVVGGITGACTALGKLLYEQIVEEVIPVSTPESAEMVKLLENTFRSINIGLANEVALMCERLHIDAWEVIDAAATKPFGFMKFSPGPGLGGHCIPLDPHYLAWKMKSLDYRARFIELAGEINTRMPEHVVELVMEGLNRQKRSVNGSRVLILGVAYKKDIDDVRESPALDVLRLLEDRGAQVDFFDPYVPRFSLDGDSRQGLGTFQGVEAKRYDAVVILTDHSGVDYGAVAASAPLIIDTRNVYPGNRDAHIIRLGAG
ncbi:MAG: nucleotide sugar dehydrogenase, partial [Fidelibacterota bacterium]